MTRASRHDPKHPKVIAASKKRKQDETFTLDLESNPKYRCPDNGCAEIFETKGHFLNHIDKNHEKEKKMYKKLTKCYLCNKFLHGSLKRHENEVNLMKFENIKDHTSRRSKFCKTCQVFCKKENSKILPWEPSINPKNQHLKFCSKELKARLKCPLCLHCPIKW